MTSPTLPQFNDADLLLPLHALSDAQLDELDFGVIGFDNSCTVQRYNHYESRAAGLSPDKVMQLHLFAVVAQCMNNFLVAQRFEDALAAGSTLDDTIDYVLTLRMKPAPVKLRLLAAPGTALRYVLIRRLG